MRGEVWRGRLDGHGDLRLEVAVPMQQDQPKQGFALAAVEGAAVVGVDQRVNTHRNIWGQETQRVQRMRFEGSNRTARRPVMSSRGRDPHDGWPASSILEERPAPPALACGPHNQRPPDGPTSTVSVRAAPC